MEFFAEGFGCLVKSHFPRLFCWLRELVKILLASYVEGFECLVKTLCPKLCLQDKVVVVWALIGCESLVKSTLNIEGAWENPIFFVSLRDRLDPSSFQGPDLASVFSFVRFRLCGFFWPRYCIAGYGSLGKPFMLVEGA